jgi:hypothetical protein
MTEGNGTFEIKVIAGFLGVKFLPRVISLAFNNLNPKLIFSDKGIEYRAFIFINRISYNEIEKVDILIATQTTNIYLIRNNSIITVSANTNSEKELFRCLEYLKLKGCSLSDRAEEFYSSNNR